MGRQIQVATTQADESELLRFMASIGPIRVFQHSAVKKESLWFPNYNDIGVPPWMLYIWPQSFRWSPVYKQMGGSRCPPEKIGHFYVANSHTAPVLELFRSDLSQGQHGRIYWGRDFAAPQGIIYDSAAFSRLVDAIWRWVRRVGKRTSDGSSSLYYLPDAYNLYHPGNA